MKKKRLILKKMENKVNYNHIKNHLIVGKSFIYKAEEVMGSSKKIINNNTIKLSLDKKKKLKTILKKAYKK